MASSLIHICIAKKINEKLNLDTKQLYLGSIAPDISKWSNVSKLKTHFSSKSDPDIPNIDIFLEKYYNNLNDPFVLGYLTHLYADKMWYNDFMNSKFEGDKIKLLDGSAVKTTVEEWSNMMYNDFSNLTQKLSNYYKLDLTLFNEKFNDPKNIIKEMPLDKLPVLINEVCLLFNNYSCSNLFIFDLEEVTQFIDKCVDNILDILKTQTVIV